MFANLQKDTTKSFIVIKDYKSPYSKHLEFKKNETVQIVKEFKDDPEWEGWIWCVNKDFVAAGVPKQYVNIQGPKGVIKKIYNAIELTVVKGEKLNGLEILNGFA